MFLASGQLLCILWHKNKDVFVQLMSDTKQNVEFREKKQHRDTTISRFQGRLQRSRKEPLVFRSSVEDCQGRGVQSITLYGWKDERDSKITRKRT